MIEIDLKYRRYYQHQTTNFSSIYHLSVVEHFQGCYFCVSEIAQVKQKPEYKTVEKHVEVLQKPSENGSMRLKELQNSLVISYFEN